MSQSRVLLRIQEVRDSNLGLDFDYPDWDRCGFPQPLQENSGIVLNLE
jgi:hypothetical protein